MKLNRYLYILIWITDYIMQGPFIEMKQLTMDAEHYICDTIRTHAPWGRRYIAFTDYDMQILEVGCEYC